MNYLPPNFETMSKDQLVQLAMGQAQQLAVRDQQVTTLASGFTDKIRPGASTAITGAACVAGALLDGSMPDDSALGPVLNALTAVAGVGGGLYFDQPDAKEGAWAVGRGALCAILYPEAYGMARKRRDGAAAAAATAAATTAQKGAAVA